MKLSSTEKAESSSEIRKRVNAARKRQLEPVRGTGDYMQCRPNACVAFRNVFHDRRAKAILKSAFDRLGLSARAYDRILKVARTAADLDNSELIESEHIMEAIQYRSLDRKYWGK